MTKADKRAAEEIWAKNKYLVLSKSHSYYLKIRDYLKRDDANKEGVERLITKALNLSESPKDVVNAYQHIWGYFKEQATEAEKNEFFAKLNAYQAGEISKAEVLDILMALLAKYPNNYLENSTIFDD